MNVHPVLLKTKTALGMRTLLIAVLLFLSPSATVFADSPEEVIHALATRSLDVVRDTSRTREEKRHVLETLFIGHCDSEEIAQRVLGIYYKNFSSRMHEFAPLFITLVSRVYTEKILQESETKKIVIQLLETRKEGDWSEVETEVRAGDEKYPVAFWLMKKGDQWRIVDVLVEGLSLVRNYRAQIAHLLHKSSFDDLLQKMRRQLKYSS